MSDPRYLFVGNRHFVLEVMLELGLNLTVVLVVRGSHLERYLAKADLPPNCTVEAISSKDELVEAINRHQFDYVIANGCPFRVPMDQVPTAAYVNIHPSYLPDLRGIDPVVGAILHRRDCGATCHLMDDQIDTGEIIAQTLIPYTEDLDVTLLYQLSFIAEQQVFRDAHQRGFKAVAAQVEQPDLINYAKRSEDQFITFAEPVELLLQKVRAFNNRSQGAQFQVGDDRYRVFAAHALDNPYVNRLADGYAEGTVILSFERDLVFKKNGTVLRFSEVVSDKAALPPVGTQLF